MTRPVLIELLGEPAGKGRARFSGHAYTPGKTARYERALATAARLAMMGRRPLDGPLSVQIVATFGVRQSWPKAKKVEALAGRLPHVQKPDADNVLKTLDALNGIVWNDDCQIVRATIEKRFGDKPRLCVMVAAMDELTVRAAGVRA